MPAYVLDDAYVLGVAYTPSRREVIEKRISAIKQALKLEENNLDKLQKLCSHPNKKNQWEENRGTYWYCDDCGKYWFVDKKPK